MTPTREALARVAGAMNHLKAAAHELAALNESTADGATKRELAIARTDAETAALWAEQARGRLLARAAAESGA